MKCNVCGRQTQNEEANFCEYCGSPFKERFKTPDYMPPREQSLQYANASFANGPSHGGSLANGPMPGGSIADGPMQGGTFTDRPMPSVIPSQYKQPLSGASVIEGNERPVSFLNFLGSYGIYFIPFIGWIAFFVMLIVWSFGNNTPETKRNWARATLIFMVVLFISMAINFMYLLSSPVFQEMIGTTGSQIFQGL